MHGEDQRVSARIVIEDRLGWRIILLTWLLVIDGGTTAIGHPDPTSRTEVGIVFSCPLFAVSTTTSQVREPPRRVEPIQSPMVGALVVRKGKALPSLLVHKNHRQ